ncbi:MAG: VaFE repeat-containing surface-anchored protein [Olsenella sp.]|jgi:TQXA domain-containing protein/LPXTG-motif cell wall-anchored protein|nr:VaFE repeat-containing surface-anchored protein [Olsenella sp.]
MKTMKVRARSARRALKAWRRDGGAMRMQALALSVALVLSQLLGALTPTAAHAATGDTACFYNDTSGDVGPFNAKTFGAYQRTDDASASGVAYCMDGELEGPGLGKVTYTCEGDADTVLGHIVANGYPNQTTIGGRALSAGEARAVTQMAIWCHRGYDLGKQGLSGEKLDLYELGVGLCREAEAYEASGGASLRCGTVWFATADRQRMLLTSVPTGGVELVKSSSNHEVTDGNGSYSLAGAVYTVYSDEACTQAVATITTDADGRGSVVGLRAGSYWARETTPASGYALSQDVITLSVEAGRTTKATATDAPQTNPLGLVLAKADAETGEASPLGAASLAGAEFEVRYYAGQYDEGGLPEDATRTWTVTTGEDGTADLSSATGDELYRDASGNAVVPLGTVAIRETRAPEGYKASVGTFVTHVTAEGTSERVSTYAAPTVSEQVRRGDLELVKAESGSMRRLAGVPFRITSATTGESHVIVTDENGQAGTAASWNAHTSRTNANDSAAEGSWDASAGVWFSGAAGSRGTAPDDSKGALPYDTYTVEELPCTANEGLRLVSVTVKVSRDATTVDLGTVDDDEGPRIATTLTGEGGEHLAEAAGKVTLTDEVAYENLIPGQEYELSGTLIDRGTGEAVTDGDGSPVTAKTKLVPKLSSGKAKVTFELDASGLAGRSVVAFEELSQGGTTVATHADVDDGGQTVLFPRIGTTATDAEDGSHEAAADGDVTITDEVVYENLVPGKEYELTGTLMDRETGEAVTGADGRAVTSTTRLTPESGSGTAEVNFSFDGSALAGRTVVAFETLSLGGREYAAHADLSDQGQTVTFPSIRTTACDASDGDKVIDAAPGQKVTDTVAYSNLVPGATYRLTGRLVDRDSGEELATAEAELTPEAADGTAEVAFDVDGSGLEGGSLVCTEELSRDGKVVAAHADLSDEGQAVSLPGIHTTATDAEDGDHEATASERVRITDRVEWSGLVAGREYTVSGTLVDGETGDPVRDGDGTPVTASATFTADATSGSTDVTFEFDGSSLAGRDVVAFETITHEGKTVATHANLEDEGQTVSITEAPPETPNEEESKGGEGLPQTGDNGVPVAAIVGLCAAAGLSLAGARALRRHAAHDESEMRIERGPESGPDPLGGGEDDE